jgi:uncharacterized phage protein (TIGR01671 family)
MNREIEFRGLPITGGGFVYGSLIETKSNKVDGNHTAWIKPKCMLGLGALSTPTESFVMVKTKTVGQFTSLLDCNGVKIFEGDITKAPCGHVGQVVFSGASFFVDNYDSGDHYQGQNPDSWDWSKFEVIGNIHQNRELLK